MDEIRCSIEVREDEGRLGPGRIVSVLMKYGERSVDRPELFETGSLKWPDEGIVLNRQHQRRSPILRFVPVVSGNEVRIDQQLPDTQAGRDAAEEVRSGLFRGLSVEFKSLKESVSGGIRRISSAMLGGVGLVDSASYRTAVEVRAKGSGNRPNEETLWL